jgi:hypothetical protein
MSYETELMSVLRLALPEQIVQNLWNRTLARLGAQSADESNVAAVVEHLRIGVSLFVDPDDRDRVLAELNERFLTFIPQSLVVTVRTAQEVSLARNKVREWAQRVGARPLIVQRLSLAVTLIANLAVRQGAGGVLAGRINHAAPRCLTTSVRLSAPLARSNDVEADLRIILGSLDRLELDPSRKVLEATVFL